VQEGEGWPWWLGRSSGTSLAAAGLSLAARLEEDKGGRAPVVRERRGALGRWVGDWDVGWGGLGRPASQGRRSEWAGWVGKEKKKEIH
jgi:hypothetical protein